MVINVRKEFEKREAAKSATSKPPVQTSTANQRESRAPARTQTLNLYGSPASIAAAEAAKKLNTQVQPKSSGFKYPAPKSREQVAADTQAILDQLAAASKRIDALAGAQSNQGATGKTILRTTQNADGTTTVFYSDGTSETFGTPTKTPDKLDKKEIIPNVAYDTIQKILESYRITGLASVLETIRDEYPEASSDDIITLLQFDSRYNAKFNERFAANVKRQKAGKSVYSPGEYLALEQGFQKVFDAYNLPTFKTQTYYDKFIEGDIDVVEVSERVQLAYDRVLSDDPVNRAFKQFYSSLGFSDIVAGMLDPVNQLPALQQKVKAAEIGGAAIRQGLTASELTTAETIGADVLAKQGVTKAGAEEGYKFIAGVLPTAEAISTRFAGQKEDKYQRLEAEQEKFQGLASAERKRKRLSGLEAALYEGSSGIKDVGLATQYLRKGASGGQF